MSEGPIYRDLLVQVTKTLIELGYNFVGYKSDRGGKFASEFRAKDSTLPFMLVAKGSQIMGDIISMQKELIDAWKGPIVLAWLQPGIPHLQWFVYDPRVVPYVEHEVNYYGEYAIPMENFSIFLGKRWNPLENVSLSQVWEQVKKETVNKKGLEAF